MVNEPSVFESLRFYCSLLFSPEIGGCFDIPCKLPLFPWNVKAIFRKKKKKKKKLKNISKCLLLNFLPSMLCVKPSKTLVLFYATCITEPHCEQMYRMCVPSEDSDQFVHPNGPSVRPSALSWVLGYPKSAKQILINLRGCAGWSESHSARM